MNKLSREYYPNLKGYGLYYKSGQLIRELVILTIFYAWELFRKEEGKKRILKKG